MRRGRLGPVKPHSAEVVAERDGNGGRNRDGRDAGDEALRSNCAQRIELLGAGGAVGNAGVFMNVLKGGEEPHLVFDQRTAQSSDVVLAGEGLFGIVYAGCIGAGFRRVLNGETSIECGSPFVEGSIAVPVVGASPGGDHYRSGGGPARVGIFIRSAHGKFLNAIGREVLQESSDPIVGVIRAVDR